MAKKDILERLNSSTGEPRTRRQETPGPAVRTRDGATTTRVSKTVVRRRRRDEPVAPPAEEPTGRRVVAVEAAGDAPPAAAAPVEKAPVAAPPPPPPVEKAPVAAPPVEKPVAVEAAPAAAPQAAAKADAGPAEPAKAAEAPAAASAAPAGEAKPAAAAEAVAAAAPEAPAEPAKPAEPAERPARFRGLGSAVVSPPPGYDPTNPEAYLAAQRRAAEAAKAKTTETRAPGRRRVATDTSTFSTEGRKRAPAGAAGGGGGPARPAGGNRGRRGRRPHGASFVRQPRRRRSSGPKAASPQPKAQKRKVRIDGVISVGALAQALSVKAPFVMKKLIEMGMMVTVNEMLDVDTAALIATEFEYEVENVGFQEENYLQHVGELEEEEYYDPRPPVVTIMGHVDHGKTTLLDTIRKARVAAGEAGGITQHIGAYQVEWQDKPITFLDTPGHAAFSAMRARGAEVTDIVILVVAADDGVQPQTAEAIAHSKAAGVPIIVAVNKIDKPGVNPDVVKQRLGEYELVPEEWGGETQFCNVSALKGEGIDELLEAVLLQAELLELGANPDQHAEGVVIESKIARGRGPVATLLVQSGTLNKGDHVVIGATFGKVRAMMDHRGKPTKSAGPSTPVEVFGLSDLPSTGDQVSVVTSEKNARALAEHRALERRNADMSLVKRRTLDDIHRLAGQTERKELLLVLKADVQGSLEALKGALLAIKVPGCDVRILHSAVGNINESDVNLVTANDGLLVGFNVKVDTRASRSADEAGVKPELYTIIYEILDRVERSLKGLLEPVFEERKEATIEVRAVFHISRFGTIAGCYVQDGKIGRNHTAKLLRKGKLVWEGNVKGLKRFKDDVKEVGTGYECGVSLEGFNAIEEGDIIESYSLFEIDPT